MKHTDTSNTIRNGLWKKWLRIAFPFAILIVGIPTFAVQQLCGDHYCNPLGDTTEIVTLIKKILQYLLVITIPLAGLGIIIAGFIYVIAAVSGSPGKTQNAKKVFTYVLIGCILVVGANALAVAVINFLNPVNPVN